jgi:hypothetical protein
VQRSSVVLEDVVGGQWSRDTDEPNSVPDLCVVLVRVCLLPPTLLLLIIAIKVLGSER